MNGFSQRILYVTPLWSALKDVLIEGCMEPRGMPAFWRPLAALIDAGHQVDLVVAASQEDLARIQKHQIDSKGSCFFVRWDARGIARPASFLRLRRTVADRLKEQKYDFVYGHGSVGAVGCMLAHSRGIRTAQRIYGVAGYGAEVSRGRTQFALRHPLEYLSFTSSKDFLMVTDDGSHGDRLWKGLGEQRRVGEFLFWRNGVDVPCIPPNASLSTNPILFCPGRIAPKKQQHIAIDILHQLVQAGHQDYRLVFSGHVTDKDYYQHIQNKGKQLGLSNSIEHRGVLNRKQMIELYQTSAAVLCVQRVSNLGNVAIEALMSGAILVALDDGSFDGILENGKSGFIVSSASEAAKRIAKLSDSSVDGLRTAAREAALKSFCSWDERIGKELELILSKSPMQAAA